MKLVDLLAGIGGFSIAGHWMGWDTLMFCEIEDYPKRVLAKNFPGILIHSDIKNLTKEIIKNEFIKKYGYYEANELIFTAGVPCQPASTAGKRQGTKDDRWLWNETIGIVRETKPAFAIFENPIGLLSLENGKPFDWILTSLENEGYEVESFVIPACSVGAWHRRNRIWIIAYSESSKCKRSGNTRRRRPGPTNSDKNVSNSTKSGFQNRRGASVEKSKKIKEPERQNSKFRRIQNDSDPNKLNDNNSGLGTGKISQFKTSGIFKNVPDTDNQGSQRYRGLQKCSEKFSAWSGSKPLKEIWQSEPELGRVAHGIPNRVDRLKALGNAIVPQVAYEIFKIIDKILKKQ